MRVFSARRCRVSPSRATAAALNLHDGTHCYHRRAQDSRAASRKATKWRSAINQIAELSVSFDTQFLRPLESSPWR